MNIVQNRHQKEAFLQEMGRKKYPAHVHELDVYGNDAGFRVAFRVQNQDISK